MSRRPLVGICILFILGIWLGRFTLLLHAGAGRVHIPFFYAFLAAAICLGGVLFKLRQRISATIFLSLLVFLLGFLAYHNTQLFAAQHIRNFTSPQPELVLIKGIIVDDPFYCLSDYGGDKGTFLLKAERLKKEGFWKAVQGSVKVTIYGVNRRYRYGDILALEGLLYEPEAPTNPGEFDYKEYLAGKGIYALLKVKKDKFAQVISRGRGNPIKSVAFNIKHRIKEVIVSHLPPNEAVILNAIALGEREEVPHDLNDLFIKTGTIHILAISGLHVGIIAFILLTLFRILHIPGRVSCILIIIFLAIYALLSGARPSVVRAVIMAAVLFLGLMLNRDVDIYNSLSFAALVILIKNPGQLFNIGFQLSFLCLVSLLYLTPRLEMLLPWAGFNLQRKWAGAKYFLARSFCASLGVWIGIMPVVAYYFNIITPSAILANLIVIPMLALIVASGITFVLAGLIFPPLGQVFANAAWLFLTGLVKCASVLAAIPGGYFHVPDFSPLYIIAFYLLILLLIYHRRLGLSMKKVSMIMLLIFNLFIWHKALVAPSGELEVTFLDVGHGDAVFMRFPGSGTMLLDGGEGGDNDMGRRVISPYLWKRGVRKIDAVVLSHPEGDHVGGLATVIKNFKIGCVLDNGMINKTRVYHNYRKAIGAKNIPRLVVKKGDEIFGFKDVRIYLLHPPQNGLLKYAQEELNNNSLVLNIVYGDISFMFTGDIEEEGIRILLGSGYRLNSTILKVPHHGSFLGEEGRNFFREVSPQTAVISVGKTKLGLPSEETLDQLHQIGSRIYRTEQTGAITVSSDGKNFSVHPVQKRIIGGSRLKDMKDDL